MLAIRKSLYDFYNLKQAKGQSVHEYFVTFTNMVNMLETVGAGIGQDKGAISYALSVAGVTQAEAMAEQCSDATTAAKEQFLALSFLMGSDRDRFKGLINAHQ